MNYSEQVFKMLGVKPYEKFYLKKHNGHWLGDKEQMYYLTPHSLSLYVTFKMDTFYSFLVTDYSVKDILAGEYEIHKIPCDIEPTMHMEKIEETTDRDTKGWKYCPYCGQKIKTGDRER